MNSKSSLRAVLRSGLLKEFLERSVGLQKGRAERNLELRWGRWWRRIKRNAFTFIMALLVNSGTSEQHKSGISESPYPKKNLTLISCAESGLGAFHFIKFLWFLQWIIGANGLKHCFCISWSGRGIKRGEQRRHIFASWFYKPFFPSRLFSMKVFLSALGSGLTKKTPQICLQIYFTIVFSDPNFGGWFFASCPAGFESPLALF